MPGPCDTEESQGAGEMPGPCDQEENEGAETESLTSRSDVTSVEEVRYRQYEDVGLSPLLDGDNFGTGKLLVL